MKKQALSLAVGAALTVGTAQVHADQILFPYFQSGTGIYTFLTLRGDGEGVIGDQNLLHYVFNYDDPAQGSCTHFDIFGAWTDFDLIQQTVIHPAFSFDGTDLPTDFGDASTAGYLPISGFTEGFITVLDASAEGALGGQAIIAAPGVGLVTAYRAINNPLATPQAVTDPARGDFSALGVTSHLSHDLTWYPISVVDTGWFVLVTGEDMDNPAGWGGQVTLTNGFGGVFDRDENFLSGGRVHPVECYDIVTRADLLNTAQQNGTQGGGWAWIASVPVTATTATGSLMYKIEFSNEMGTPATAISEENPFPNLR